jgi:hypothetical protein
MIQRADLSLCHLLNTAKCYKRSRGKEMFRFKKPGAYAQTLKSKDISTVRFENKGSGAIAPIVFVWPPALCHIFYNVMSFDF